MPTNNKTQAIDKEKGNSLVQEVVCPQNLSTEQTLEVGGEGGNPDSDPTKTQPFSQLQSTPGYSEAMRDLFKEILQPFIGIAESFQKLNGVLLEAQGIANSKMELAEANIATLLKNQSRLEEKLDTVSNTLSALAAVILSPEKEEPEKKEGQVPSASVASKPLPSVEKPAETTPQPTKRAFKKF